MIKPTYLPLPCPWLRCNPILGALFFLLLGSPINSALSQDVNIDDVNGQTLYLTDFPDGFIYLHDSGGPFGSYQDFEDYEVTICSDFQFAGCPPPPTINCMFDYIDIEPYVGCGFDWLQIDNGELYCNDNYPPLYGTTGISAVSNESGCMTVRFHSDASITYEGFTLRFEADHPFYEDPDPLVCGDIRQGAVEWSLHGCPTCIDFYECDNDTYGPYWGGEVLYTIAAEGQVTLTVGGNVDFFVYGSYGIGPNCPPIYSIACATGNTTSVSFDAQSYANGIWVIVDGEAAEFTISLTCNPCDPDPVDCGQVIYDFLNTGTDDYDEYDCVGPLYPYEELIYEFTPETSGWYTFHTYGYTAPAPAIIISDCCGGGGVIGLQQEGECDLCEHSWNSNSNLNALEVFLQGGETYYIIIEKALNSSTDEFQFWIDCDDPLECDPAPPLECGDLVTGDNFASSGPLYINLDYCGYDYNYWTGGEKVYSFYAEYSGQVTFHLFNLQADLDLFVLDECDGDACQGESTNAGTDDEWITIDAQAGETYYIVIDGYLTASSVYFLSIECSPQDCKDCGQCFTYTMYNKGNTTDVTCIPKYRDCAVADYPTDDHTFQWTVNGVVRSTKYKPTLSLETGRKVKVCQIVKYFNVEQYRCCWDIEPSPGCNKAPVAYVEMEGEWPLDNVVLDAAESENGQRYFWDFGDGSSLVNGGTDPDIEHTYSYGGYKYCTYVQNDHGISTYCKTFAPGAFECTASENPQFTYTLTGRNLLVRDINGSAARISSYTIDFGDSTAVVQGNAWTNRNHTFEKDSVYEVCIRYVLTYSQGSLPCSQEGCVCFTVKVNCCQQTVDNCYDLRPVYLSSNGGLEYRFEHQVPGIQVLQWEIDGQVLSNSFGNTVTYLFPQAGFYRVCCYYRNIATGCYIKCCKWIYIGDPFDPNECGSILYRYLPESNGYRFELNLPASAVEEIQWTVDAPVFQTLGTQLQSNVLPVPGDPCQEYIISVRYFDKNCNCYRLCCLRVFICNPTDCSGLILSSSDPYAEEEITLFTNSFYEQMQWYANGNWIGDGPIVYYTVPQAGAQICLYYYDPVSQCYRVCCRDLTTATEKLEALAEMEIYPNPAADELNIRLSFHTPVSAGIELINDLGVVVRRIPSQVVGSASITQHMDLGDLPSGLYLVRIRTDRGEITRRIIHL